MYVCISAVVNGKCVDTSMGLTPNAGIMMGSRCGDIDCSIIPYIMEQTGMSAKEMDTALNKKSGLLGVSGVSSDSRDVEAGAKEVSEQTMLDAIFFGHEEIKKLVEFQEKIVAAVGKPKMEVPVYEPPAEMVVEIEAYGAENLKAALMDANKLQREENVERVKQEIAEHFMEKYPDNAEDVAYITQKLVKKIVRRTITLLTLLNS